MKTLATLSLTLLFASCFVAPSSAANAVRISQVYSGGGAISGATAWDSDYVELFNLGPVPVDLSGWTIEYGTPSGAYGSSAGNIFTFPQGASIAPCGYVLVAMQPGAGGFPLPVTPDYLGTLQLNAASGKVGLFSSPNPNTTCGSIIPGTVVDKVSYGSANCPENTSTGPLNVALVDVRNNAGMDDTDDNFNDFTREEYAEPRSSESGANLECLATPTHKDNTWGQIKGIYRR